MAPLIVITIIISSLYTFQMRPVKFEVKKVWLEFSGFLMSDLRNLKFSYVKPEPTPI